MPYGFVSYCKGSISTNIDRFWRARGYTQFIDTHTENENLFKRIFTISLCVWKHCVPLSQTLIEKWWLSTLLGNWKKTKAQCKTPTLNHLNCALFWNQLAIFRTQSLHELAHLFRQKIWDFQKDSTLALTRPWDNLWKWFDLRRENREWETLNLLTAPIDSSHSQKFLFNYAFE